MHTAAAAAAAEREVLWYVCVWWRVADIKEIKVFSYVGMYKFRWKFILAMSTRFSSVSDSPTKTLYIVPFCVLVLLFGVSSIIIMKYTDILIKQT